MKYRYLPLLSVIGICWAAEPAPDPMDLGNFKTLDGKTYEAAKVIGHDDVGIKIVHAGGTARIAYDRLPGLISTKFKHDPAAAEAQLKKEAHEQRAHDQAMAEAEAAKQKDDIRKNTPPASRPESAQDADEKDDEADTRVEELPPFDGKAAAERVLVLRNYISRLQRGIASTQEEIAGKQKRAASIASRAMVSVVDAKGRTTYSTNESVLRRAEFIRNQCTKLEAKIKEANRLITKAEAEIESLQTPSPSE